MLRDVVVADLIGDSPGIAEVRKQVTRLVGRFEAGRLPPVLIEGETGTGKGLLSHALHRASPRRSGPFMDVNCSAIPETLLEAEMFGVERGAFTGAGTARPGLFQAAHRGTLFLDEIGLVPEALQSKLLRAVEDRTVRRLGRTSSEPVDVWVLAATNEELEEAVRMGRFRPDLYHRLAVVTLRLPPLRERPRTPERDRQELELQLALGPVLVMTERYAAAEVEAVFRRAQALCEGIGEMPQLFPALWGIAVFHIVRGDLRSAHAGGERLLRVATQSRDEELLLEAHLALGVALFYQGVLQDARAHFEASISLYDVERHAAHAFVYGQDPCVASLGFLGWVHVLLGHESEALSCIDRALRRLESVDHAFSRAFGSLIAAAVHEVRGDFRSMLTHAEQAIALATEHRFPFLLGGGICFRARALVAEGRHAEGPHAHRRGAGDVAGDRGVAERRVLPRSDRRRVPGDGRRRAGTGRRCPGVGDRRTKR